MNSAPLLPGAALFGATTADWASVVGLAASLSSVVLAVVAIGLSYAFFRASDDSAARAKDSADQISTSVAKLEALFSRLYADTFGIMKETFTDLRAHAWPDREEESVGGTALELAIEQKTDAMLGSVRVGLSRDLGEIIGRLGATDARLDAARRDIDHLLDRAIHESRNVGLQARETTLRDVLMEQLASDFPRPVLAEELVSAMVRDNPIEVMAVLRELRRMRDEGLVSWEDRQVGPATVVRLTGRPISGNVDE